METRLSNILKTTNATKFIKTILKSTYKVLLGTYNLAAPMRPVFLSRAVDFQAAFDIQSVITFALSQKKLSEVILFRSPTEVSENTPRIISIGSAITVKRPFKKLKILFFLASFISKIKTADIFNFLSVKYFDKGLLFLKI